MKVTQVAIRPTQSSIEAGRPSLTPELLAAVGARYSRNNEGLDAILSKIDFGNEDKALASIMDVVQKNEEVGEAYEEILSIVNNVQKPNLDKGVDSIFNMLDYGHQSIADMTPVAMFMDGISIFAAYYIWSITALAGGQESSTRYIKMSLDGLLDPEILGIPEDKRVSWMEQMGQAFEIYQESAAFWENLSKQRPELMRIPKSLIESTDDKDIKKVDRMRRNYVFDRARVYIPVGAATNVMMIQSARAWANMISTLLSHPVKEFNNLGEQLKAELAYAAPRLLKHARYTESTAKVLAEENKLVGQYLELMKSHSPSKEGKSLVSVSPKAYVEVSKPSVANLMSLTDALKHRENRYSMCGTAASRIGIRFGWQAVAIAEIRDLNRHRTGTKFCPLAPVGFYAAEDQVPQDMLSSQIDLNSYAEFGKDCCNLAIDQYHSDDPSYVYWCLLGTQFPFEHITTADKFIYESELRTGLGAHYRYAKHLYDVLDELYKVEPEFKGLIKEGLAEPE